FALAAARQACRPIHALAPVGRTLGAACRREAEEGCDVFGEELLQKLIIAEVLAITCMFADAAMSQPTGGRVQWDETKPIGLGPANNRIPGKFEWSINDQREGSHGLDMRYTCTRPDL